MSIQNTYYNAYYGAKKNVFNTLYNRYNTNLISDGGTVRSNSYVLGNELVVNGNFDVNSSWGLGIGWSINGGVATHSGSTGSTINQNGSLTVGKKYQVKFTIVNPNALIGINGSLVAGGFYPGTSGTFTTVITALSPNISFYSNGDANTIDGISVKEILVDGVTKDYMKFCQNTRLSGSTNNLSESIKFAWLGEGGIKTRTSGVNQYVTTAYGLPNKNEYGSELLISGDFSNSTGWVIGSGWSISNNTAVGLNCSSSLYKILSGTFTNVSYKIVYTIVSISQGSVQSTRGNDRGSIRTTPGTYTDFIGSTGGVGGDGTGVIGTNFTGVIDNIQCYLVLSYNATQSTTANQPYLSGNIAPNERYHLKNVNGTVNSSAYMSHPTISFGATDAWSLTFICNRYKGALLSSTIAGGGTNTWIAFEDWTVDQFLFRNESGTQAAWSGTKPYIGKNVIMTLVAVGNGTISLYVNGVLTATQSCATNVILSYLMSGALARSFVGKYFAHIIRSQALTANEVLAESTYLRTIYPEMASVDIGSTTQIYSTDFSNSTNWTLQNGVTISGGTLNFTGALNNRAFLPISTTLNRLYRITYTVVSTNGSPLNCNGGSNTFPTFTPLASTLGTKSQICTSIGGSYIFFGDNSSNAFVGSIDNLLIEELPQTWTTSNYEAVCTPQGNIIQEMQAAANVEKFLNGGFNTTASWNTIGTAVVSGGTGNFLASGDILYQNIGTATTNAYYRLRYTIVTSNGGSFKQDGGTNPFGEIILNSDIGSYTIYIKAVNTNSFFLFSSKGFIGSIDNVSLELVGWADSQNLYNYVSTNTVGDATAKTYAGVKAASMWCHYNNDVATGAVYGKLYNWFAVKLLQMDIDYWNTANPTNLWGWRVPTQADFTTLSTYLGGDNVSGGKMKVAGTTYWNSPNTGADNSSGFSALPSGIRYASNGSFLGLNTAIYLWTATNAGATNAYWDILTNTSAAITSDANSNGYGAYIRLIKA